MGSIQENMIHGLCFALVSFARRKHKHLEVIIIPKMLIGIMMLVGMRLLHGIGECNG